MRSFNALLAESSANRECFPYERFMAYGPESLTDAELLAIIIRTGSNCNSPVDIAGQIMDMGIGKERGLNSLFSLTLDELMTIHGIGQIKAIKLKCIAEIAKRMSSQTRGELLNCSCPSDVADYFMEKLRHEEQEKTILLCLDNKLNLIEECLLSIGTVNSASLSPRDVFMRALRCGASNIILLHNHPTGDPSPSRADVTITNKICESGIMLDIRLQDHIIIGDRSYCSLREKDLLWQ